MVYCLENTVRYTSYRPAQTTESDVVFVFLQWCGSGVGQGCRSHIPEERVGYPESMGFPDFHYIYSVWWYTDPTLYHKSMY